MASIYPASLTETNNPSKVGDWTYIFGEHISEPWKKRSGFGIHTSFTAVNFQAGPVPGTCKMVGGLTKGFCKV